MRTRRSPVPFLVALFLAPAVLFPCPAQAAGISIDGRAVGPDGRGIGGARVELRPILSRYAQGVREALGQGPPEPEATNPGAARARPIRTAAISSPAWSPALGR